MREEEAKLRWCPMYRMVGDLGNGWETNRVGSGILNGASCCIASDCMAWRATDNEYYPEQHSIMPAGYCGLSGKP